MDDDSCAVKYIEIVPLDDCRNCSDIKQEPVRLIHSLFSSSSKISIDLVHIKV